MPLKNTTKDKEDLLKPQKPYCPQQRQLYDYNFKPVFNFNLIPIFSLSFCGFQIYINTLYISFIKYRCFGFRLSLMVPRTTRKTRKKLQEGKKQHEKHEEMGLTCNFSFVRHVFARRTLALALKWMASWQKVPAVWIPVTVLPPYCSISPENCTKRCKCMQSVSSAKWSWFNYFYFLASLARYKEHLKVAIIIIPLELNQKFTFTVWPRCELDGLFILLRFR